MDHKLSGSKLDHRVAIVQCDTYDKASEALQTGIELLGGLEKFYSPGEELLLKPNVLLGDSAERGSTTHPEFFRAVIQLFNSGEVRLTYGDSPGFGSPQSAGRASGLDQVAADFGVQTADFNNGLDVNHPDGLLMTQFNLAKGVTSSDGVINLPKFKAHGLMRLTGAVKNLFGCLPGVQKAGFHARLPDEFRFGEMLVDLAELISPRLHIMDGIFGMEGNGPRNGQLRNVGLILISTNPHALDFSMARIMNLDPMLVPTLKAAYEHGLLHPDSVEVLGEPLESIVIDDFDVNRSNQSTTGSQAFYMELLKRWVTPRPVILSEKCSHCGRCVAVCPASPKALSFTDGRNQPPKYDYENCIRCYCCQEMCPEEAIVIHKPIVGRILDKLHI